jgi:hypothetical protein
MENNSEAAVRRAASTASHIGSLCVLLADALGENPDTSHASEAMLGLSTLAIGLSSDLHGIVENVA